MKLKTMSRLGLLGIATFSTAALLVTVAEKNAIKHNGTITSKFENLIDNKGVPVDWNESQYESRIAPFADLGSWHAFALPDYNSPYFWGGFTQPLIVRKEYPRSLAKSLDVLSISEYKLDEKNQPILGSEIKRAFSTLPKSKVHIKQYPGGLWQEFEFSDFTVQLNLRFVQNKTSFVKYNIINKSNTQKAFDLSWTGKTFAGAQNAIKPVMSSNAKVTKNEFKRTKYGQILSGTNNGKVLYYVRSQNMLGPKTSQLKGFDYVLAAGFEGHAPDTINNWKVARPHNLEWMRAASNLSKVGIATITPPANGVGNNAYSLAAATKAELTPIPAPASQQHARMKNTMTINFEKPTSKGSGNFLGHSDEWQWNMKFGRDVNISTSDSKYEAKLKKPFIVKSGSSNHMYVGTSFTFTAEERLGFQYEKHGDNMGEKVLGQIFGPGSAGEALEDLGKSDALFNKSVKRWETYIKNLIGNDTSQNFDYQKVAVKAMETLTNNWRGGAGMLEHQGVTPSLSIQWFNEFWSWDTWKQASAEVNFDPKLAIDNVKVMYDYQVTRDPQSKKLWNFSKVRAKNDVGMIPDLVAYEQGETNWRDTKPPLSAWAVDNVISTIMDKLNPNDKDPHTGKTYKELAINFGKYMYNRIAAYHAWWYTNRDGDHNGINEYGGTIFDGKGGWVNNSRETITTAVAWESGMDNAPRFDQNGSSPKDQTTNKLDDGLKYTIQRNKDGTANGYVIQQESVDLNSYMFAEKKYMISIAKRLKSLGVKYSDLEGNDKASKTYKYLVKPGIEDRLVQIHGFDSTKNIMKGFGKSFDGDIQAFSKDMEFLGGYINNKMFDKKTGFFYDLKWKLGTNNKRDISKDMLLSNRGAGPEGFIPLWAEASTSEHSNKVRSFIMDPEGFNTYMPFPSAAKNNNKFEPDEYWRGPVWLDQAYFGVQALERSGYHNNASYMVDKLYRHADGLMDGAPIRENYNPLTGKGLNAKGFSWSSGMYLLMYKNFIQKNGGK